MATEKFEAVVDRGTVLTTELNALADAGRSAAGPAFDNSSNRDRYFFAELVTGAFASAPDAGATSDLYYVSAPDGTNYDDGSASIVPQAQNYLGSFMHHADTGVHRLVTPRFELPPMKVKLILVNGSGEAYNATGNTVRLYSSNRNIT